MSGSITFGGKLKFNNKDLDKSITVTVGNDSIDLCDSNIKSLRDFLNDKVDKNKEFIFNWVRVQGPSSYDSGERWYCPEVDALLDRVSGGWKVKFTIQNGLTHIESFQVFESIDKAEQWLHNLAKMFNENPL